MRRIIYARQALLDIDSVERFWRKRDPELLDALADKTRDALAFLVRTPGAGSPFGSGRKWRIGRTPFLIFYIADDDSLTILRVRHERENWLTS